MAAALFSVGLFGVLARRNAIAILMGIELMLNAVNLNLVTFWRYRFASSLTERLEVQDIAIGGQVFVLIVLAVAAAEASVGLALIISIYRRRSTIAVEEIDLLKW
jgi:NADH-quinone oxidoreductase subunit K